MPRIIYTPRYNIGFFGLERLHPFDSRKYGRAWKLLQRRFGRQLKELHVRPKRPATADELQLVHAPDYLAQLCDSDYLAEALEVPQLRRFPSWLIDRYVLLPMRWATAGTILAAREALKHGLAINMSGGYHHAKPNRGEGFSIYNDIGIAIESLRRDQAISESDRIVYVDTDAHQGNGVCHTFMSDTSVFIFDVFNCRIYPNLDVAAKERIDCEIAVIGSCSSIEYIRELQDRLPEFLDSVANSPIGLAVYNAGTDVIDGDPLGGLRISAETIYERDLFVVRELRKRNIPTVMVLSGGYTQQSYQLVATSVIGLIENELAS